MKKKVLIWVLAAVLVLSMAGCAAGSRQLTDFAPSKAASTCEEP